MIPRVLFVDDEPMFLASLERMFKMRPPSWEYQFATTGRQAQSLAGQGRINVIVADLMMPDIDGLHLLSNLKSKPETRHIPVIMLTGRGDEASAIRALHHGAADYLVKGALTQEDLGRAILSAFEKLTLKQQAEKYCRQLEQTVHKLEVALARVRELEGLLPICMFCKKVRTDEREWLKLETYIEEHSEASFSHSLCPTCKETQYPELSKQED